MFLELTPKMMSHGNEAGKHFVVEVVDLVVEIVMPVGGSLVLDDEFHFLAASPGFRRFPIHHPDSRFH